MLFRFVQGNVSVQVPFQIVHIMFLRGFLHVEYIGFIPMNLVSVRERLHNTIQFMKN